MWQQRLLTRINAQQNKHLFRSINKIDRVDNNVILQHKTCYINFSSNNYLGLAQHPNVIQALNQGAAKYGLGSTASPLICGYYSVHQALEEKFADFLQRDRALLFSSGYMANLGVITTLANKNTTIFADKNNHASLHDACRLSGANFYRYLHNDIHYLSKKIGKFYTKSSLIVSDGVFSMAGNIASADILARIANNYDIPLILDDAHGIGILGKNGKGTIEHYGLNQQQAPIIICPLGKAFGSVGAIVAGPQIFIEALIQFARTYIYSTAISPAIVYATNTALEIMQKENWRREKLLSLINLFRILATKYKLPIYPSQTAIQSLIIGDTYLAQNIANKLLAKGFYVKAMRAPTVPKGTERLRFTLTCQHEEWQIKNLICVCAELFHTIKASDYAQHIETKTADRTAI